MSFKISTDIGGTFTDVVVVDNKGITNIFKTPTTPQDRMVGVIEGLKIAAEHYESSLEDLMKQSNFISHGSTVSTNALIEGNTAKVGLICTEGHRDILSFREGGKAHPFEWYIDYPEPYVPRYLTLPVKERINSEGEIETPLNEDDVRLAVKSFKNYNVEVIAVSLLWSFINPENELRIAEIIKEEWPEAVVTLSHLVNPRIREYRRTVSTVIDASLKPLNTKYIESLQSSLKNIGYDKELYLFTSSGGLVLPENMINQPIYSIDSGPSLAPISGKFYAEKELNQNNVITCDMGGTSFDIGRVTDGNVSITNNAIVQNEKVSIPKADIKTIGAGGGSIAWVDEGGLIRIGPEGAGSEPGPACYMNGGTNATVTDAALLLGYLNENYFLGGRMEVSEELAKEAIRKNIAVPLNIDVIEAAYSIWNTATAKMTEAIRDVTIWEGIDPKKYVFVAGGGAAGVHIIRIVSELGAKKIIVPKTTATLSAFGGTVADIVAEFEQTFLTSTDNFDYEKVNNVIRDLKQEGNEFLERVGISKEHRRFEIIVEARYPFQEQDLTFTIENESFEGDKDVEKLANDFHETHDQVLGSKDPNEDVECLVWKVRATGLTPEIGLLKQNLANEAPNKDSIKDSRMAYFNEMGEMVKTPVFDGNRLKAGNKIVGPAIIEEPTTNLVVFPDEVVNVSEFGSYIVNLN